MMEQSMFCAKTTAGEPATSRVRHAVTATAYVLRHPICNSPLAGGEALPAAPGCTNTGTQLFSNRCLTHCGPGERTSSPAHIPRSTMLTARLTGLGVGNYL